MFSIRKLLILISVIETTALPVEFFSIAYAADIQIIYPLDSTIFPPDIISPKIWWSNKDSTINEWHIELTFNDDLPSVKYRTRDHFWIPSPEQWESTKKRSTHQWARLTISGLKLPTDPGKIISQKSIRFSISSDSVGAPIFYREVPLPFKAARENLGAIKWRLGNISSYDSTQVVMNNMPTCANCHSFSADGNKVGMDIDFRADKGGYMIAEFTENTVVTQETILSWTDFNRNRRIPTLGLLSRISPDGNFILSSVHDRSVFIDQNDPYFSQLFFPVRGILAFYDVKKQKFFNLPGADDPEFVQSNGVWSPDGQTIIFARAHAPELNTPIKYIGPTLSSMETALVLGTRRFMDINADLKPFLFDLYKIPFNDGKGGSAELLQGASNNGKSNFFAKYSPDGKWIVFTQAPSYMLNQRGSELYIMPANDGPPRRMNCNTSRMNSWHSWSPNSKWLVFSSKELGPYTQLFLTHIDEKGYSTPPVWLRNFTSNDRAVNIPEFVNIKSGARRTIDADYIRKNNDLPLGQQD